MATRSLYEAAWILGLIAGVVCLVFAFSSVLGYIPEVLDRPLKSLTGMASAGILGILGFLILGVARMTKRGGAKATTGGIFLLVFGFVAYLVGGAIGAILTMLSGLLALIAKHV